MKKIDTPDGKFSDGNPAAGTLGTKVTATWLQTIQDELVNAIEGFGAILDPAKDNQLYTVLNEVLGELSGTAPGDYVFKPYEPTAQQLQSQKVLAGAGGSVLDTDYQSILDNWGGAIYGRPDATHFYLPRLCGYFPRFWGGGIDPGADSRLDRGDGTTGNGVGTLQMSQNMLHGHACRISNNSVAESGQTGGFVTDTDAQYISPEFTGTPSGAAGEQIGGSGGSEARSSNIYIWGGVIYK